MVIKIAISGKAKSGKNTIAEFIADYLLDSKKANSIQTIAFADPMKEIIRIMFPKVEKDVLWGSSEKRNTVIENAFDANENPLTCRSLLLDLGKFGRSYNYNIWIQSTIARIQELDQQENMAFLISDVRFKNELTACKADGFVLIRVIRPDNDCEIQDISEVDLDDVPDSAFDFVINNDNTLEQLKLKIRTILLQIK